MGKLSEDDLLFRAMVHAEQDVKGLAEAWSGKGPEAKAWDDLRKQFRAYRKKRWPKRTCLHDEMETLEPTPLEQVAGGPDRAFFRSPPKTTP